jgi:Fe-S-cluster containining protein
LKACNQCGKCCIKYSDQGLSASSDEIESWELFRPDIYRYVKNGEIWIDPNTGAPLTLCPWLRKAADKEIYSCDIYDDRPEDCRHYPVSIADMEKDECEMLELIDLAKPKQAQKKLDRLMIDSRPPMME